MPSHKVLGLWVGIFAEEVRREQHNVRAHDLLHGVEDARVRGHLPDEFFVEMAGLEADLALFSALASF